MDDHPSGSMIALLVQRRPAWADPRSPTVAWCDTASELAVLARHGHPRAVVIDALLAGLDTELVGLARRSGPVLVIDVRANAHRWVAAGASVIPVLPPDEASLLAAVEAAESAARTWIPRGEPTSQIAALVTILASPGGDGTAAATSTACSLVASGPGCGPIVLADLTLDAPHRALHGLGPDRPGLPELIEAGRFGPAPPTSTSRMRSLTNQGYLVVPGLLHHHDWVTVGDHAAGSALGAIRREAEVVIAHVDRDLEGETDTGSFDIEDRNVLARTAVRASDLVLVAAGTDRSGRLGVIVVLGALARFGVPRDRIVVLRTGRRRRWPRSGHGLVTSPQVLSVRGGVRPDARFGRAIRGRLESVGPAEGSRSSGDHSPQPIGPGTLGSWGHDIEGWITPRVPQQP